MIRAFMDYLFEINRVGSKICSGISGVIQNVADECIQFC